MGPPFQFRRDMCSVIQVKFTKISYIESWFKVRFIQYSGLFRVWLRQVPLYIYDICTLSDNIIFICTSLEMGIKSSFWWVQKYHPVLTIGICIHRYIRHVTCLSRVQFLIKFVCSLYFGYTFFFYWQIVIHFQYNCLELQAEMVYDQFKHTVYYYIFCTFVHRRYVDSFCLYAY